MDTVDMHGITGDISILVGELSRFGCSVAITEWVDDGAARIEAHLPEDEDLAEKCRSLIEERKGPIEL
jgi:hypothetical protein